ncbi:MAG: type II secretion system F family protein [Porticoccaceae bacterium]
MFLGGNRVFLYRGKNSQGKYIEGRVRAKNSQWARYMLRKKGIKIQSLQQSWNLPFARNQTISASDIVQFTRQLATLIKAGIPIRRSFDILANSQKKPALKQIIREIHNDIYLGDSLAKSLRNYPHQFNHIFCNMVNVGEITGTLTSSLEQLAQYQERVEYLKKRVKQALTYPVIVLLISVFVTAIMLTVVIPNFAQAYREFGSELPLYTQLIIDISITFDRIWLNFLASVFTGYIVVITAIKRSPRVAMVAHRALLKLPLAGDIVRKVLLGRFTHTLATTISAGLPIIDALKSAASTTDNLCYKQAIIAIREDVIRGLSLYRAVRKQSIFPVTLQQMIDIGEESGSLASILAKASQIYESDIELLLDTIIPLIEPVMMIVLGIVIGGLLVAMYLPVFQLGHIY